MMDFKKIFLFLLLFILFGLGKVPVSYQVIAISDGDTFTILNGKKQIRIRVDAIDAPEKGMPYSKSSKKFLSDLCFKKNVKIITSTTDRYGRTVARAVCRMGKIFPPR